MIRNTVKAIIVREDKLLVCKKKNNLGLYHFGIKENEVYFDLPGGGQSKFESLEEALRKKCLEELGCSIRVNKMVGIYEQISPNFVPEYAHKINYYFICELSGEIEEKRYDGEDGVLGLEWKELEEPFNLKPSKMKNVLSYMLKSDLVTNWGIDRY